MPTRGGRRRGSRGQRDSDVAVDIGDEADIPLVTRDGGDGGEGGDDLLKKLPQGDPIDQSVVRNGLSTKHSPGAPGTPRLLRHAVSSGTSDRSVFCQMDVLYHFSDGEMEWRESARWIKYEERVEVGEHWSKPYVATVSLHALFELRRCISDGVVILDMIENNIFEISGTLVKELAEEHLLTEEDRRKLLYTLTRQHQHQHTKKPNKQRFHGRLGYYEEDDVLQPEYKFKSNFPFPKLPQDGPIPPPEITKQNKKIKKKLPIGTEAANIMIGEVDFLDNPVMALVRLTRACKLQGISEVDLPTKFIFLLLGPPEHHSIWEYEEVGRAAATLLTDKIFCEAAYMATSRKCLLDGIDEFIDDVTVLPPCVWDPATRLEPPQGVSNTTVALRAKRKVAAREAHFRLPGENISDDEDEDEDEDEEIMEDLTLKRTGRLFGGLVQDVKRRYPLYWSDIKDAMSIQVIATIFFLYFACITPIVTFGGVLGSVTHGYMGTMECILSGALCGLLFHTFAGQPLTIIGATGPMLVFESILYRLCNNFGWEFLPFRFWIGCWAAFLLLVIVALDLSALVRYITRFTEECFAVLVSLIFIYEAFSKQFHILDHFPFVMYPEEVREFEKYCDCVPVVCTTNNTDCIGLNSSYVEPWTGWLRVVNEHCINIYRDHGVSVLVSHDCLSEIDCVKYGGILKGAACTDHAKIHGVPDVFLFSFMMFLATFVIALTLKLWFPSSRFFPAIVRKTVADFGVVIAVIICTSADLILGLPTPKLNVPEKFETTLPNRGWFVNPLDLGEGRWWMTLLAVVPAILAVILIFLDQQITAVIVNRKEHKLKKGHGYHLDLCVLAVMIALCSLFGIPWFVAATVQTLTHVRSLVVQTNMNAPGEKPQFMGVREQRVTGLVVHLLIFCSIFLTEILKHIPMSVLYGVFLYMGVSSLRGVQFIQRTLLLMMPQKYRPDYVYLRHVKITKVHLFTLIQILCMASMWVIKKINTIAIAFPLLVLALGVVRILMRFFFTTDELHWLDDVSPEEYRRDKEDKQKLKNQTLVQVMASDKASNKVDLGSIHPSQCRLEPVNDADINLNNLKRYGSGANIVSEELPKTATWRNLAQKNKSDVPKSASYSELNAKNLADKLDRVRRHSECPESMPKLTAPNSSDPKDMKPIKEASAGTDSGSTEGLVMNTDANHL